MYISDYKKKTTTSFFIGTAIGHARLDENDLTQDFSITVFYPMNESKPYYVPKLKEGQVISVINSKFAKSMNNDNEIDVNMENKNLFLSKILNVNIIINQFSYMLI